MGYAVLNSMTLLLRAQKAAQSFIRARRFSSSVVRA
jgi:hypothetical protein